MMWRIALWLVLAVAGKLALPGVLRFLHRHGLVRENYAGQTIPAGTGTLLVFLLALFYTLVSVLAQIGFDPGMLPFAAGGAGTEMAAHMLVFAVGWIDDSVGDRSVKGLSGHWRNLLNSGTLSTGALKAIGVGAAALWVVAGGSGSWAEKLFDWMTIVLAANAMNLLDVRPGRAWKCFLAGAAVLLACDPAWSRSPWLLPATAGALALLPGDLRGRHMLGDSGANLLGFALGCSLAASAPLLLQAGALLLFAAMHRAAETGSITQWIERHKWVRWLDRIGRV